MALLQIDGIKNALYFLAIHLYILEVWVFFCFPLVCLFPECNASSESVPVINPEFITRQGCGRGHLRRRYISVKKRRKPEGFIGSSIHPLSYSGKECALKAFWRDNFRVQHQNIMSS